MPTRSKLQAAAHFVIRNAETILQILTFAAAFLRAIAESEKHAKR